MAVKVKPEIETQQSTGAVEFRGYAVTSEQSADAASTGAVEHVAPGTTEVAHYTEDVVVNYETPGPVTVTASWLSDAQNKVIGAPKKTSIEPDAVAEVK
ncbi:hypothetical protein [Glaciihabitans sp. UYNi722]|uniref:hypothetical protein n=1 Tax=Glaciihabitans sp. UYNi722 TaxID=3156344 RepID=UPI0033939E4F